jgi:hypothetical protein
VLRTLLFGLEELFSSVNRWGSNTFGQWRINAGFIEASAS